MELTHLGQSTKYATEYTPSFLEPIPRAIARQGFSTDTSIGFDAWRLYEISYLDKNSCPKIATALIIVDAKSPCIVESKSLKLYIGSFTLTKFTSLDAVAKTIERDLSNATKSKVKVTCFDVEDMAMASCSIPGICIDNNDISAFKVNFNKIDKKLLAFLDTDTEVLDRVYYSNIIRTLCPVTSQPDFATVIVSYKGFEINKASLLAYFASYRCHQGFHEACTEQIYNDLKTALNLDNLCVRALFTRRGGIDINPARADNLKLIDASLNLRTIRQ